MVSKKRFEYMGLGIIIILLAVIYMSNNSGSSMFPPNVKPLFNLSFSAPSFELPSLHLFSIGIKGVNSQNLTNVGTNLLVNINIAVPSQYLSTKWNSNDTRVVVTKCGGFVFSNNTQSFVYQTPLVNESSSPFIDSFNYTIPSAGYYAVGGVCESESTTWNSTTHEWNNWTAPKPIETQIQPIDAVGNSGAQIQPQPPKTITINNIYNNIIVEFDDFVNWLEHL